MIYCAGIDRSYWALAMHTSTYIRNRVWSRGADGVSCQLGTCLPPKLDCLRVVGCPCFVHIDKQIRRELDDRAWKVVFVGYALDSPSHLVWNLRTRSLVRSHNVEFNELAVVSSTIMGQKMQSLHENDYDSDDDRGATVQTYEDQASS